MDASTRERIEEVVGDIEVAAYARGYKDGFRAQPGRVAELEAEVARLQALVPAVEVSK